eukprot:UN03091
MSCWNISETMLKESQPLLENVLSLKITNGSCGVRVKDNKMQIFVRFSEDSFSNLQEHYKEFLFKKGLCGFVLIRGGMWRKGDKEP